MLACSLQELTGGFKEVAAQDLQLAWQLLLLHVDKLGPLHVNLIAPLTAPGMYMVPIFVTLSALVMGLEVGSG